jgi:PKHD-type hydroxylase
MLITIDALLAPDEAARTLALLDQAPWIDGARTAGAVAREAKHNEQVDETWPEGRALAEQIAQRLRSHPRFISAVLPRTLHPPRFNRYRGGGQYGAHVDAALMHPAGASTPMRTDLSATLFLADPADYDGGVLEIETAFGVQPVKLAAGDLVLYPASSLHRVTPVTRGARVAAFLWVESLVRDAALRELLFDLDSSIQALSAELGPAHDQVLRLSGTYHNLLRTCV